MNRTKTKKKVSKKLRKITQIEKAIIYLAEFMENPFHDQYQIKNQVMDILGVKEVKSPK